MIYSMTGFAAAALEMEQGTLSLELRSVNHRYLEVQFRLEESLRPLEPAMRELIAKSLSRGKVDCRITFTAKSGGGAALEVDAALVAQLVELNRAIRERLPDSPALTVADVLRWPGVVVGGEVNTERLRESCLALLQTGLEELTATRGREGAKLEALLLQRAEQIERLVAEVRPLIPKLVAAYQEKLVARLKEAMINFEDDRLRLELALFAQKIDVDEELSRLQTHVAEVRRVLDKGGAVGKRLDFLMQELNREANTLGSKSVAAEVSRAAMELKVLIEQMREQIQNIE
jgi:uncharacterized protein (TIGR00255 family)